MDSAKSWRRIHANSPSQVKRMFGRRSARGDKYLKTYTIRANKQKTISVIKSKENIRTTVEAYDKWENKIKQDFCSWKYVYPNFKISTISQGYKGAIEIIGQGKILAVDNEKTIVCIKIRHRRINQLFNIAILVLPILFAIIDYPRISFEISFLDFAIKEIAIISISLFTFYLMLKAKSGLGKKVFISFEKEMNDLIE